MMQWLCTPVVRCVLDVLGVAFTLSYDCRDLKSVVDPDPFRNEMLCTDWLFTFFFL